MVVFTGASVEEAIQEGLRELDIPRMKAHITVISREKKGFLGLFGKKPAQVDVEPISETTMVKANQKAVKGVPEEINAKNDKQANTILEETGTIDLIKNQVRQGESEEKSQPANQEFSDLGIEVEENYDIEEVVSDVTAYVQEIINEMDVEASLSSSYNRRTVNMQIDTNEPGRVIGYHGKVLKALQLLAQNYLYIRYEKSFYISINVNDYVEHRAEVLQSYAQKLANKALEERRSQPTDPMSNNERKIIHRIISKMDGVTSYSEGDEPNRYVVVDIDSE